MPLIHFSPISMKALNGNIDDDLIFNPQFTSIRKNTDDGALALFGATNGSQFSGEGSRITLTGEDAVGVIGYEKGSILFEVPYGAAPSSFCWMIMKLLGSSATPSVVINAPLSMANKKIGSLADPTLAQDAVTKTYVDTTLGVGTQGDLTVSAPIAISDATRHLIGGAAALSLVNDAASSVTEIDTGTLASSDTKIPTSKATKDAVDLCLDLAMARAITGSYLKKSDDNGFINISGGNTSYGGLQLQMFGSGYASVGGWLRVYVPNAAANGLVPAMYIKGKTDTPTMDLVGNRIEAIGQATSDMDAVPQTKVWTTWTPTVTWTTGTPASISSVYRYCQIGKTVFFKIFMHSTDGNGATALTVTVPVTSKDNGANTMFTGLQLVDTTYSDPLPMLWENNSTIYFRGFKTCTDAKTVQILVEGFYEVA